MAPVLVGLVLGVAVCFPWLHGGRLWLLDWVIGPHQAALPPQFYGLEGGVVAGLPLNILIVGLGHVLGPFATVLPAIAFFPVAAAAAASLTGGGLGPRIAASLAYTINPFVFDRLYAGQFGVLLGYALLPWALAALIRLPHAPRTRWLGVALWWTALISASVHYLWIFAVPVVVVAVVTRLRLGVLVRLGGVILATAATTVYVAAAGAVGGIGIHVGRGDLLAYRTAGDAHLGLAANVLGLYGFWRPVPHLAKSVVAGWPALLVALLVVAGLGLIGAIRNPSTRRSAIVLAGTGLGGFFLAMGDQGPTGAIFRWAYLHVPFFAVMREPEKFACLVAVVEAVGFGWGVGRLVSLAKSRAGRRVSLAVGLALPLAYEPLMFAGLAGQVHTTQVPDAWARANAVMGSGPGSVLVLPWHEYVEFPYTDHRVVANPAASGLLARASITGDNVELPNIATQSTSPRSAYLTYLYAHAAQIHYFGALVSSLGVRYIALERTADFKSYTWLGHQSDLKLVLRTPSLDVYRNMEPTSTNAVVPHAVTVANWASIVSLAEQGVSPRGVVVATHFGPGPISSADAGLPARTAPEFLDPVRRLSPVAYAVPPAPPGAWVQLSEPYQPGWRLNGQPGVELADGNLGWPAPARGGVATFTRWPRARLGYLVSGGSLLVLIGLVALDEWKQRRR